MKKITLILLLAPVSMFSQTKAFITKWNAPTANESITIPITMNGGKVPIANIDWGDGTTSTTSFDSFTNYPTHTYTSASTLPRTVTITPTGISTDQFKIYFNGSGDKDKITEITQWGDIAWSTMNRAFTDCKNLNISATAGAPILTKVTDMHYMFYGATSFNGDISKWDVSNVTNMSYMFNRATSFNGDISKWDVSKVTNMSFMFGSATSFNGDISKWDVSKVTNMSYMFYGVTSFNGDISKWDVSKVTNMSFMFGSATSFNGDISKWDVSKVRDISYMLNRATSFNGDISKWDVSKVTNMSFMFKHASSFNGDISKWDVSNVTDMSYMFNGATSFNGDISKWDVSKVTDMRAMFWEATSFNGDISKWDVSNVTDMHYMFNRATSFNGDISKWDVSKVTDTSFMFWIATLFNGDISKWDVSKVTDMRAMFYQATSFNQDISKWDVSKVKDMSNMFVYVSSFNGDISKWDVSNVTDMNNMFVFAISFNGDISKWNVSNVTDMKEMFWGATSFNGDISNWNVSNVTDMRNMFNGAVAFDQNLGAWDISSVTTMENMFYGVTLSTPNYDNTLIGWSNLSTKQSGVTFSGGNSQYCVGESARTSLIDTGGDSWIITDRGKSTDCNSGAFVTTWVTTGANKSITIPITMNGAEVPIVNIDWGDGATGTTSFASGNHYPTHTYTSASTLPRTVTIIPTGISTDRFKIYFNDVAAADKDKITKITQWGDIAWSTMNGAFLGCKNLNISATAGTPNLTNVTDMRDMFAYAPSFNGDISNWDVSNVTDMSSMFNGAVAFDQNLGAWDISSVTTMANMFDGVTLSTPNYDNILIDWSNLSRKQSNVTFSGGDSKYCVGERARTSLIDNHSWTITDGGKSTDCNSGAFVTTWVTTGANESITIPTDGTLTYDYSINWGDKAAVFANQTTGNPSHTYTKAGTYTVAITGTFPHIYFNNSGDKGKITEVTQWGSNAWKSMSNAFAGCTNLTIPATDSPDLSSVTDMSGMFDGATSLNIDLSSWSVGTVTDMSSMFKGATSFNQDLGSWDISSVTNINNMLDNSGLNTANYDSTLIGWDTPNVPGGKTIPSGITLGAAGLYHCSSQSAIDDLTGITLGWTINDEGESTNCTNSAIKGCGFKIYPNPVIGSFNVKGKGEDECKIQLITVYTIDVRSVVTIKNNFKDIDISSLKSGFYFVKIITKKGEKTIKIIKE